MAGYAPKSFYGHPGEDPLVWLQEFRQWCEAGGIDPQANHRNRVRIHGAFETCLKDDAKDWYENNIRGKNWECQNILDNTGVANLNAFNALNNGNLVAINANQFRGNALIRRGVANATGADIIPSHNVWEEDWSIAGGRPTDMAPNAPNAGGGGTVVAEGMRIGQVLYEFITNFPTITAEKSKVAFSGITQGLDTVNRFFSNLRRMVKLAYPTLPEINQNEMVRQQFLNNLSNENKLEARRIGLENPTNVILRKLEEIERYRKDIVTQPSLLPLQPQPANVYQGPSLADIERLIDSKLKPAMGNTFIPQAPKVQEAPKPSNNDPAIDRLFSLALRLGFPEPNEGDSITLDVIENFIDEHLRNNLPKDDIYNTFHIKRFGSAPRTARKTHTASKPRKCSKCGKSGHTKSSCSKGKKKKSNYAEQDSSSSESGDCDTSSGSDSDDRYCFGIKKKPNNKKSQKDRYRVINEVFLLVLKSMVESFVRAFPKEMVVDAFKMLNVEFSGLKDSIINRLSNVPSMKTREKIWDNVRDIFINILQPMITVASNESANNLITRGLDPLIQSNDGIWSISADIGIMSRKSASDIVTIKCRIIVPDTQKSLVIPISIFDTGSDSSLISSAITKRLECDIDKTNAPDINGVASNSNTLGTVYGLGIAIYDSENSKTIEDDFMVIESDKDFLLLGVPWIDRAKAVIDFGNRQLHIPISQRKKITIPISLHKRKNNATSLQLETIDLEEKKNCEKD
jgi:hypothetical protein